MNTPAIIRKNGEIRVEATDTIHIVLDSDKTITIQDIDEDETESTQVILWTSDIDLLVDALITAKNEIRKKYGYG